MASTSIAKSAFNFLEQLRENNDRNWFAKNKDAYKDAAALMGGFADSLLRELNKHDVIETMSGAKSLYRIYRDVRFSKDQTPFSTYWGGRFRRAGSQRRGGYYYHFEPGNKSFLLCGFWSPSAQDLKLIRDDIAYDPHPLSEIIESEIFRRNFGTLRGEKLKTTPKGYDKEHKAIDLLRYKQFLVRKEFTDSEVLSYDFLKTAEQCFRDMRPFLNYMSDILTLDFNGQLI